MNVFLSYQKDKAPVKLFEQDEYLVSFKIAYAKSRISFQEELGIDSKMLNVIGSLPTCHSIGRLECVPVIATLNDDTTHLNIGPVHSEVSDFFWMPLYRYVIVRMLSSSCIRRKYPYDLVSTSNCVGCVYPYSHAVLG